MDNIPVAESPKVPNSQQEAQDTVLQYLQRTVNGLPPGTCCPALKMNTTASLSVRTNNGSWCAC